MARIQQSPAPNSQPANEISRSLLESFAQTAEAVATTKLEKAALPGGYLRDLDDADLARAAHYFAGHQFAMNDARTTNVGTSILRDALSEAANVSVEELRPRYVRLGDAGEVAYEVVVETKREYLRPTITLAETELLIERLSEMRGTKNKKALLATVLARGASRCILKRDILSAMRFCIFAASSILSYGCDIQLMCARRRIQWRRKECAKGAAISVRVKKERYSPIS